MGCHHFAEKIIEIGQTVLGISYFEERKSSKIGFLKSIFDPWGHKWAPIFVFMCYICSVIKNKEFDLSQGVFTLLFWKIEFFFHFALLPVFTKSATMQKRAVVE